MNVRQYYRVKVRVKKESNPFVFVVKTDNTSTGSSSSNQFSLPLIVTGAYNFSVDWGDSTSDNISVWNAAAATHTYSSVGTYTITITGLLQGWRFANTRDRLKILDIQNWGIFTNTPVTDVNQGAFQGCSNLDVSATDSPTFLTGNQQAFFRGCSSLVGNSSFSDWDVSPINHAARFFNGCTNFNQNINNWNVSNITNFDSFLFNCPNYNQPMNNWNVSAVQIFTQMFRAATSFNQNLGVWNMGSATTLTGMFFGATAFNNEGSSDINNWNVSNVTVFAPTNNGIFQNATAFNQPLGNWNVSKASNLTDFMRGKTNANYSAANLDAIYNGWSALTFVNAGLTISFNTIQYTSAGAAGRAILTGAPNNWTITDGGQI